VARLRKDQTEALLVALESATSGPLEEITIARERLTSALRIVLESEAEWDALIDMAADTEGWSNERRTALQLAAEPQRALDAETVLWELWDLVTELSERRTLG